MNGTGYFDSFGDSRKILQRHSNKKQANGGDCFPQGDLSEYS